MGAQPKSSAASSSGPVTITYRVGNGAPKTRNAELLVVACDPRSLACDYRPAEKAVFGRLSNFTFHTSLLTVKGNPRLPSGVVFAPTPMDKMDGSIYAFRNETAKTFGLKKARSATQNLVTVYQLLGPGPEPWTPAKFQDVLKKQLKTLEWWPYGRRYKQDYEITDTVTTPYFDQFSGSDLKNGLPWQFLGLQGKHNTIYAHASTCFESILQCWQYAKMLLDPSNNLGVKLPTSLDAPIVILGAGASGILFAHHLVKDLKYTNVEILESTDRSDGKIHTIKMNGPYPPGETAPTYCELGACYLSPAYADLEKYLLKFVKGNKPVPLAGDPADAGRFRAIWALGQFPGWRKTARRFMTYDNYIIEKAKHDLGYPESYRNKRVIEGLIGLALFAYLGYHELYMGKTLPVPTTQPTNFDLTQTFDQFLQDRYLIALVGLLQYGYSVQGYGALKSAPAYYGMTWITPDNVDAIIEEKTLVKVWEKGWGDVWRQLKAGIKITCNATTTNITRSN
jgi:hypothetical protein